MSVRVPTAGAMHELGVRLAAELRAGDLVILSGELGAGKTALTQGIGAGLDVTGAIISPTFVLVRRHQARGGGPGLIHADAYRLGSGAEIDDLDLETDMADAVTVVEWGLGRADHLAPDWLEVTILRSPDPEDDTRSVTFTGHGPRWVGWSGSVSDNAVANAGGPGAVGSDTPRGSR